MRRAILYVTLLLWSFLESLVCPLMAQATLGAAAVTGTVRDQQGSPVPDARITLTDDSKGMSRESSSDSSGEFLFPAIGAGTYTVRIEKTGFSAYLVNNLAVDVGQRAALNISLRVGQIRTSITVSAADAVMLDTQSNTIGTVIDPARVADLPLNGRNFLQLGLLAGGALEVAAASNVFSANVGQPWRTCSLGPCLIR